LTQEVEGLSRDVAMKSVIGPVLTDFLRPIYTEPLSLVEADRIPVIQTNDDIKPFAQEVVRVVQHRLATRIHEDSDTHAAIDHLTKTVNHPTLFHYQQSHAMLREGVRTSVATPLLVATQIYRTEKGDMPPGKGYSLLAAQDFDYPAYVGILQRDSYRRILSSLAKGPNGFLGGISLDPEALYHASFFNFFHPQSRRMLMYWDAFRVEGRVTGLSDAFYIAAQAKRAQIQRANAGHPGTASSGCPVRHSLKDKEGVAQESLITSAAQFLIGAVAVSSPAFKAIRHMVGVPEAETNQLTPSTT